MNHSLHSGSWHASVHGALNLRERMVQGTPYTTHFIRVYGKLGFMARLGSWSPEPDPPIFVAGNGLRQK
jgi:hypothetical protein